MAIVCRVSGISFEVSSSEKELLSRLGAPLPALCPDERARARLAWRNERTLYRRSCDATGKSIVSIHDKGAPFPVYSQEHWWSDSWDALEYGRDFDFSRRFFPQFLDLYRTVPQVALRCPQSENCEYTNQCEKNKDCYLIFCSSFSQSCYHGMWFQGCVDSMDCTYLEKSELCYELVNCTNCYGCTYSQNLENCSGCHFSRDLIGCTDCLECVNLRNKSNCYRNEQLSKAELERVRKELRLDRASSTAAIRASSREWLSTFPFKYYQGRANEDFSGDYVQHNKRAFDSFNVRHSEEVFHCRDAWKARNSIDMTETLEQDFCIALEGCYANVNCGYCAKISEVHDAWYSSHCFGGGDLFGCVGLRQKQFCILNKEFARDDFLALRGRIIEHMKSTGEWGEWFPIEHSPFAYNESVAQEYFALSREEVLKRKWRWKEPEIISGTERADLQMPDSINDVPDTIVDEVIVCRESGRRFKVQRSELALYRKLSVPIPEVHPLVRHQQRMELRNPRRLGRRACSDCGLELTSTFSAERTERVLCDACYQLCTL